VAQFGKDAKNYSKSQNVCREHKCMILYTFSNTHTHTHKCMWEQPTVELRLIIDLVIVKNKRNMVVKDA
jgi:hypothetical protein